MVLDTAPTIFSSMPNLLLTVVWSSVSISTGLQSMFCTASQLAAAVGMESVP